MFYDDVRLDLHRVGGDRYNTESTINQALDSALVFGSQNVANYVMECGMRSPKDILDRVGIVAPLSAASWFEWNNESNAFTSTKSGVLIYCACDSKIDDGLHSPHIINNSSIGDLLKIPYKTYIRRMGCRWLCTAIIVVGTPDADRLISVLPLLIAFGVKDDGTLYRAPNGDMGDGYIPATFTVKHADSVEVNPVENDIALINICIALTAVSFGHCRNVQRVAHVPPERLQKSRIKRRKEPLVTWHTLEIGPISQLGGTKTARFVPDDGREQSSMRLHIVKGNFATYTAERPLFGKYVGQFYRPSHQRGDIEQGVSGKDYLIKAAHLGE